MFLILFHSFIYPSKAEFKPPSEDRDANFPDNRYILKNFPVPPVNAHQIKISKDGLIFSKVIYNALTGRTIFISKFILDLYIKVTHWRSHNSNMLFAIFRIFIFFLECSVYYINEREKIDILLNGTSILKILQIQNSS